MRKRIQYLGLRVAALLMVSVVFFNSCETEVDVYDDYQIVPVVYGILDPGDDGADPFLDRKDGWHWIKITRSFQSKEDPFAGAAVRDSSAFDEVQARIIALDNQNQVVQTYELIDSLVAKTSNGEFYGGAQRVYGFKENNLNPAYTYRLEATCFHNGESYEISAETNLIDGQSQGVFASSNFNPVLAGSFVSANRLKDEIVYEMTPAKNTRSGDLVLNFYYKDVFIDLADSTIYDSARVISISIGGFLVENLDEPRSEELFFSGVRFFERLNRDIPDADEMPSNFIYRKIDERSGLGEIEFISGAAGEDLFTYIEVNEPANEGFQARPVFSNIEGGIGIFSSRTIFSIPYFSSTGAPLQVLGLSNNTKEEIGKAEIAGLTGDKAFCFDEPAVADPCPEP